MKNKPTAKKKPAAKKKATVKKPSTNKKSTVRKAKVATAQVAERSLQSSLKPAKIKLSSQQKKEYKQSLLELRSRVEGQISFLAGVSLNKAGYDLPVDNGSDDFDRDFALNLLGSEQNAIFEINEALQRLDSGKYGRCELCNKAIGKTRLKVLPFAKLCIDCQSSVEKDRPHYRPLGETLSIEGAQRSIPESDD